MPKIRELSEKDRGKIIFLCEQGYSQVKINKKIKF